MRKPRNDEEALTLGLVLGITAPDDKLAEVVAMCESIAARLTPEAVERCKAQAADLTS